MATIFTKIINGEIPCHKLFENEFIISFLDIRPIQPGHALVVPKIEVNSFIDAPEPYYSEVFKHAQTIARAIQKATSAPRIGTAIIGFEVPHFHYHLVPMWKMSDLDFSKAKTFPDDQLSQMKERILATGMIK